MSDLILIGKVVSAHGLKGEIKVKSFTKPTSNIGIYKAWILNNGEGIKFLPVKPSSFRTQGQIFIFVLEGINNRDSSESLVNCDIYIKSNELPALKNDEYYWHQLIGLAVFNVNNILFGNVEELMETGANDVLVVKPTTCSIDGVKRLIPYVSQYILRIDLLAGKIIIDWDESWT